MPLILIGDMGMNSKGEPSRRAGEVTFLPLPPRCALAPLTAEWHLDGGGEKNPKIKPLGSFLFGLGFLVWFGFFTLPPPAPALLKRAWEKMAISLAEKRCSCAKNDGCRNKKGQLPGSEDLILPASQGAILMAEP